MFVAAVVAVPLAIGAFGGVLERHVAMSLILILGPTIILLCMVQLTLTKWNRIKAELIEMWEIVKAANTGNRLRQVN